MTNIKMDWKQLNKELGNIDLYWLDFILKGHLPTDAKILDAGCGEGRNIMYCLKNGMNVFGIDQNPEAIRFVKLIAKQYQQDNTEARFQLMKLDSIRFPDDAFDTVLCSAVLHFAESTDHFNKMLSELFRVVKMGGKLVIRTMSDAYLAEGVQAGENGVYVFPEGQKRFIVSADTFVEHCRLSGFRLIEPYKEVKVKNRHTMGTFFLERIMKDF